MKERNPRRPWDEGSRSGTCHLEQVTYPRWVLLPHLPNGNTLKSLFFNSINGFRVANYRKIFSNS